VFSLNRFNHGAINQVCGLTLRRYQQSTTNFSNTTLHPKYSKDKGGNVSLMVGIMFNNNLPYINLQTQLIGNKTDR